MTDGCGNWRCQNPYCHSNLCNKDKKYNDREASLLAKEMFQKKINPDNACKKFGQVELIPLTRDSIDILASNNGNNNNNNESDKDRSEIKEDSDEYKECVKIITMAMEHWDILEQSFLIKSNNNNNNNNTKQNNDNDSNSKNEQNKNNNNNNSTNNSNSSDDNQSTNKTSNESSQNTVNTGDTNNKNKNSKNENLQNEKKSENDEMDIESNKNKNNGDNNNDNNNNSNSKDDIISVDSINARINYTELDSVFRIIMCHDNVSDAARSALLIGLEERVKKPINSLNLPQLRSLLILLENPLCLSEDPFCYQLLSKLLNIIDGLNPNCHSTLIKWLSQYDDTLRLKNMLDCLQHYMTIKIMECEDEIEDETQQWKEDLGYDENGMCYVF